MTAVDYSRICGPCVGAGGPGHDGQSRAGSQSLVRGSREPSGLSARSRAGQTGTPSSWSPCSSWNGAVPP